jgi:polysaccharide biosynthesis/export protein
MEFEMRTHPNQVIGAALVLFAGSLWAQSPITKPEDDPHLAPAAATSAPSEGTFQNRAHEDSFIIGNDDVLSINVWKEPDISRSLPVRSDGMISLPLIGDVQAAGRTPSQLQQAISSSLRNYIDNPEVTVIVQQINSKKFNILGQVTKPGSYPLTESTTVLDAIALAGGLRDFAKKKSIYVLRSNSHGGDSRIMFNYKAVIDGNHPEQNIKLEPRDTIVVP